MALEQTAPGNGGGGGGGVRGGGVGWWGLGAKGRAIPPKANGCETIHKVLTTGS